MASNSAGNINVGVQYVVNQSSFNQVNNSLNSIRNRVSGVQTSISNSFSKVGKVIAAAFSVAAVTKFYNTAKDAYKVQMIAETKLETVMKQRMNATQKEINKIKELSTEYQKLGVIGDEVALTGMAQLSTFAKNSKSLETIMPNFNNALVGMYGLDVTASQAQSFANQIGKALANGDLGALSKSGMTFTEAEKGAFKLANELERAEILSKALVNNYGEMNEVVANTPMGRLKQLNNAWSDVVENLGNALTNITSAFVPALMKVVGWLENVSTMLVKVSEAVARVFGGKFLKNTGIGGVAADASAGADAMGDLSDGYEDAGKAAKKATDSLASFDNTVQLSDSSDSDSSGSGGGGSTSTGFNPGELIEEETSLNEIDGFIDKLKTKFEEFKNKYSDLFDFSNLESNLNKIADNIKSIFENIKPSAKNFINSYINSLKSGSIAIIKVGKSVIDALTGGIALWLEQGKDRISESWSTILDNFSSAYDSIANIFENVGNLLSDFFHLEDTQQTIANIITSIEALITGVTLLLSGLFDEIAQFIDKTITENYDGIQEFLSNIASVLSEITGLISTIIIDVFSAIYDNFNKYVRPAFTQLQEGFSKAFGAIVNVWNTAVFPLIKIIIDSFKNLWEKHLKVFVNEVAGMIGAFIEMVAVVYNKVIAPIVAFVVEKFVPPIMATISVIWGAVEGLIQNVIDIFSGLAQFLKGVFEVITGIFTGDWNKACEGLLNIANGLIKAIANVFSSVVNVIIGAINGIIRAANNIKIPGTDIGVNISEIPRWEPKLANGGVVYNTTNFGGFIAGEAGAEAIVPLENSGYTKTLAREIVSEFVNSGMSGNTYQIENAFGDARAMERLVNQIAATQKRMEVRKGAVAYG